MTAALKESPTLGQFSQGGKVDSTLEAAAGLRIVVKNPYVPSFKHSFVLGDTDDTVLDMKRRLEDTFGQINDQKIIFMGRVLENDAPLKGLQEKMEPSAELVVHMTLKPGAKTRFVELHPELESPTPAENSNQAQNVHPQAHLDPYAQHPNMMPNQYAPPYPPQYMYAQYNPQVAAYYEGLRQRFGPHGPNPGFPQQQYPAHPQHQIPQQPQPLVQPQPPAPGRNLLDFGLIFRLLFFCLIFGQRGGEYRMYFLVAMSVGIYLYRIGIFRGLLMMLPAQPQQAAAVAVEGAPEEAQAPPPPPRTGVLVNIERFIFGFVTSFMPWLGDH